MTEHLHKISQPEEEVNIQIGGSDGRPRSAAYWITGSIIIGALLVALSIFYNTKMVLKHLDSLSAAGNSVVAAQGQVQGSGGAAGQQAPGNGQPVKVKDREGEPVIGSKDAKVTIYEFSDFQCPFCTSFFKDTYGALKSKYIDTGKVKLIYRNFPLPFHQAAQKAAEAAECANRQGKFEQYYEKLFSVSQADGTNLAIADLKKYADELGLNKGTFGFAKNKFNQCLDSGEAAAAVKQDTDDGTAAGVNGTPTLFVNGQSVVGAQPLSAFEQAIEQALK